MQSENCGAVCSPGLDGLKPGDAIRVRPASEIVATLDAAGTMDGLPFMPEMAALCGREFKVACCINRTCVEGGGGLRIFRRQDVVILEDARCDGRAHGDCQKACFIFWKKAWLEPVGRADRESTRAANVVDHDLPVQTRSPDGKYFCQSTELIRATSAPSSMGRLRICLGDLLNGSYAIRCFVTAVIRALNFKLTQTLASKRTGKKPTPTEALDIQPGEVVQVKSLTEISETVDGNWTDQGLGFTRYMLPFCGGKYRVQSRVDRIILENTGEMLPLKNAVILEGLTCDGHTCFGVCLRRQYHFWRGTWVRRVPPSTGAEQV